MDIHKAIEETQVALNLFLNNHFTEAKNRLEPWLVFNLASHFVYKNFPQSFSAPLCNGCSLVGP